MQPTQVTNRARPIANAILLLAFIAMILALFVPTPPDNGWLEFHFSFSLNLGIFVLFVGASILFLTSLRDFTTSLKRAYLLICGGITLFATAYLQVPFLILIDQYESFWVSSGLIVLPFLTGVVIAFAGTRAFARLIGITSRALGFWFALAGSVVVAAIITVLPHVPITGISEAQNDAGQAALMVFTWWMGLTAYHALLIKRRGGLAYTNAMAWLVLGMACLSASALIVAILYQALPERLYFIEPTDMVNPINLLASIFYLRSAYSFNRIPAGADMTERSVARNFFGKPHQEREQKASSSVDIVVYTVNLVSNPRAIDSIMEEVRVLTSKITREPMSQVTASEEDKLMSIYLNLEEYLTKQEPVRTFTRESLRQDIATKLGLASGSLTFWDRLPAAV